MSEFDVYIYQILTSKDRPRTQRFKQTQLLLFVSAQPYNRRVLTRSARGPNLDVRIFWRLKSAPALQSLMWS